MRLLDWLVAKNAMKSESSKNLEVTKISFPGLF